MRIAILLISGLVLAGCSQTPNSNVRTKTVVDDNYVTSVESVAHQQSVDVIWVNPPTKRVESENN